MGQSLKALFALLLIFTAQSGTSRAQQIYSLVARTAFAKSPFAADNDWLVEDRTLSPDVSEVKSCIQVPAAAERAFAEMLVDYETEHRREQRLNAPLELEHRYRLITPAEIAQLYSQGKRSGRIPHAIALSVVGFSTNGEFALLHDYIACGNACGAGEWHVLQRSGSSWKELHIIRCESTA